jgi:hypothetical protein
MAQNELAITKGGYRAQFGYIDTEDPETQVLDGTSAAATSAALAGGQYRLSSVEFFDLWIKIDPDPTAANEEGMRLAGTEYFLIRPGDKISVIGGKLNITKVQKPSS